MAKEYRELEEQGRLLKLPCNVGDTVVYTDGNMILEYEVYGFLVGKTGISLAYMSHYVEEYNRTFKSNFKVSDIGKTIFFTKEEAEAKLKKMKSE